MRALLLLVAACSAPAQPPAGPDPTQATRAAPVAIPKPPPQLVGVVTSRVSKVISTDFEGRIEHVDMHDGQLVHAGDIVARLDASELRAKLAQATAQRQSARAQAARAGAVAANAARKAKLERRLGRVGASSPEAYRNAMSEASAAGAEGGVAAGQIREAGVQIEELEKLIARADVAAPIDGVVSVVRAKEGEVARKGAAIARVFDPSTLVIRFAVPRGEQVAIVAGTVVELVTTDGHRVTAVVEHPTDEHDPAIEFTVFEAPIDGAGDVRVGDHGHVRIAVKGAMP